MSCIYKDSNGQYCKKNGSLCLGSGASLECYTKRANWDTHSDPNEILGITTTDYDEAIKQLQKIMETCPQIIKTIIPDTKKEVKHPSYCRYCFNARVYEPTEKELIDPWSTELTDDNDLSYHGVGAAGNTSKHTRIMIASGGGKSARVQFDAYLGDGWDTYAEYYPKYCPECGRRLDEYDEKSNDGIMERN